MTEVIIPEMGFGSPSKETPEERIRRLRAGLKGYADAGIFGRLTYTFVGALLALGKAGGLDEDVGPELLPNKDTADKLAARFDDVYDEVSASSPDARPASLMWRTYFLLYRLRITSQMLIGLLMVGIRVGQPLLLRKLVSWFWAAESAREGRGPPISGGEGWMWACLLALFGYLGCLTHHAFFWRGMRNGLYMRLQAMAAIQRKVLRLNAVGVADVTPGKIINILSSDVRRFDDSSTHGLFLVISPIELAIVLVLIGIRMGFPAAVAGVGTSLLLIPVQALLGRHIVKLRAKIAALSDERVRLTSEAISGVLAAKMLVWEPDLLQRILAVRKDEDACVKSQARIRGVNMGVAFAITPLASLITFAVVRATGRQLTVANVFYTIALLQLPKLFMADFFVKAVETLSELSVTMRRLGDFMAVPEPPEPYHSHPVGKGEQDRPGTIDIPGLDFDWDVLPWVQEGGEKETKEGGRDVTSATNASEDDVHVVVRDDSGQTSKNSIEDHHDTTTRRHHTLSSIVLHASPGELIGVIGEVGAGKSSLLEVILGELQPLRGGDAHITVSGSLAYVAQVPWVCAGTVRDNITFGKAYDKELYDRVLTACALNDDLALLATGDRTELGERGINLSGGQKARLTLARAAYSQANVQVLDDPLSAVDPRVAKVLFESCLGPQGIMSGSTRVLATHQAQFLGPCDTVLVLRGGRIAERGTLAELVARQVPEALSSTHTEAALDDDTYDDHNNGDDEDEMDEIDEAIAREEETSTDSVKELLTTEVPAPLQGDSFTGTKEGVRVADKLEGADNSNKLERSKSSLTLRGDSRQYPSFVQRAVRGSSVLFNPRSWRKQRPQDLSKDTEAEGNSPMAKKEATAGSLVVTEDRRVGSVRWSVYKSFLGYMGWPVVFVILAALLGGQAIYIYGDYWIALWSSKSGGTQQEGYWIWGYGIMVGSLFIISLARAQLFFVFSLRAATALHNIMIARVLRAPLSFFHTNPAGRILNRFSKDQGAVDDQLPLVVYDAVQAAMQVLGAFVLLMVVIPVIIPIFLPLGLAFVLVYRHYVTTSREVKRYEAVTRSPVFASFSALLKGLPSIRAYGAFHRFRDEFLRDLTVNGAWYFVFVTCARWVGFRMDVLVALLMTAAPLLMMGIHDRLTARLVGLGLSQSLQLGGVMQWMTRQTAEMENHMTSVERMLDYTELEQEPPTLELGGKEPPGGTINWPSKGTVQFDQVTAVYRRGLPPVLRVLSFTIPGGASCGVVGRTGSGKSSLLLALFRLIPVVDGVISIDGVDTSSIALDALRRQIAIIPQDPVLFSGTLRSNLDPWNRFDDAVLWDALRAVQLEGPLRTLGGLAAAMLDGGENLSVGQRQLFCLARALLQGASILALDEATANVDGATDGLIQEAVRSFGRGDGALSSGKKKTVIVIAHRIHTIMDCDKLLVLSAGRLVETGKPTELAKGSGVFARLVHAARGGH